MIAIKAALVGGNYLVLPESTWSIDLTVADDAYGASVDAVVTGCYL